MDASDIAQFFRWLLSQPTPILIGFGVGILFSVTAPILFRPLRLLIGKLTSRHLAEKCSELEKEAAKTEEERIRLKEMLEGLSDLSDTVWLHRDPPSDKPEARKLHGGTAPIICVFNLKGGVGKTTVTANLAAVMSRTPMEHLENRPPRILLVDADWQGSLTELCSADSYEQLVKAKKLTQELFGESSVDSDFFRQTEKIPGLDEAYLLGANGDLATVEEIALLKWATQQSESDPRYCMRRWLHGTEVQDHVDYVLIDCPPRLTTASVAALVSADYVLIPAIPDNRSLNAVPLLLSKLPSFSEISAKPKILGVAINLAGSGGLTSRQSDLIDAFENDCEHAWKEPVRVFKDDDHVIRRFTEAASKERFPGLHNSQEQTFKNLVQKVVQITRP